MQAHGTALVTGASRGIGRAVAQELARRGFEVLAGVRRPEDAAALHSGTAQVDERITAIELDVTDLAPAALPDGLRVLVNNAGVDAPQLPVEHSPSAVWRAVFETNFFGLVELTRRAIPKLRAAGGGVICNVTSCSLLVPMPFFAVYRASKAAVSALGESLRAELAPFGIRLLEIQPGAIRTDMLSASEHMPEAAEHAAYRPLAHTVFETRRAIAGQGTSPEDAARTIVDRILDDEAPLRASCDPMGAGLLEAWRGSSDEEMMRGMLARFRTGAS